MASGEDGKGLGSLVRLKHSLISRSLSADSKYWWKGELGHLLAFVVVYSHESVGAKALRYFRG